jgi:hypothetical protein
VSTRKDGVRCNMTHQTEDLNYAKNKIRIENGELYCHHFMFNHEDENPRFIIKEKLRTHAEVKNIIVIRDKKNLFASRLKCDFVDNNKKSFMESLDLYEKFLSLIDDERVYCIDYNTWVLDIEYRKQIANDFEVKNFDDSKHLWVPSNGSGSSFDGRKFHKKADKMEVFVRWKEYENHDWFKELIL